MTGSSDLTVVFVSLAYNQARFFGSVGRAITAGGGRVAHVLFHQRSAEVLRAEGETVYDAFAMADTIQDLPDPARFGIDRLNLLLSHEKAFYGLTDTAVLTERLKRFLAVMDRVLEEAREKGAEKIVLVQELGGFCSVLAGYWAARARGVDNWFIEPSFFRKRMFFVRNSFKALAVPDPAPDVAVSAEVAAYLENTRSAGSLVIPLKDAHHYRSVTSKLFDFHNVRRLIEKGWDKHVLGKREEFGHIGHHVVRHIEMFLTNQRLKRHYRDASQIGRFIYYPLHVPTDFALTIRSPLFLDQYALLDYIARSLPPGHMLAIKEHPALVGAVDYRRVADLLRRHDNLVILHPGLNNYRVMEAASAVMTVNSKSGAEALLLGKSVVVLGDAFYRASSLVEAVDRLDDLAETLARAVGRPAPSEDAVARYFQAVWDKSHPGELYDVSPANVEIFARSLLRCCGGGAPR